MKNGPRKRKYMREYDRKNRERILEYQRAYRKKNRDKTLSYQRDWRARNPEKFNGYRRKYALRVFYGLTPEQHEAMAAAQEHLCAICGGRPRRGLHVDHNHLTGKVRGLLCGNCNRALGLFHDRAAVARKAAAYLEYHE